VLINLKTYLPKLKQTLAPDQPFGIGLRLADGASRELLQDNHLLELQQWLSQNDFYVFTLNGFPYGSFHRQVVKDQVYAPDWSTPERLDYTQRLVQILAALLPEGMDGSISTLPISYKPWWVDRPEAGAAVRRQSVIHLALLTAQLLQLRQTTGQLIHIGLEPEPDGLIENTREVIEFFDRDLLPLGSQWLQQQRGLSQAEAVAALQEHIRICYDTCHFAVEYEQPEPALQQLTAAGIQLSKVQLSSALRIPLAQTVADRQEIWQHLQPFAESTYLHQVIAQEATGELRHYPDLAVALPHLLQTSAQEWRTHFHVPIFIRDYARFSSTQDHLTATLGYLQQHPYCSYLEIETYTWDVLPPEMKLDVSTSIQREYEWVLSQFDGVALNSASGSPLR
jgi:hypothetical protein